MVRIRAGLPTILHTGFKAQNAIVLTWGDQFVICKLGGALRRPIEVYHFNPLKFDISHLTDIQGRELMIYDGIENECNFGDISFAKLYEQLEFTQNELDKQMETAHPALRQIGNSSFLNAMGAIYVFMLMGGLREIDSQGHLIDKHNRKELAVDSMEVSRKIGQAFSAYQGWLSFLQVGVLEDAIDVAQRVDSPFSFDERLFETALKQACNLPFDDYCEGRLIEAFFGLHELRMGFSKTTI